MASDVAVMAHSWTAAVHVDELDASASANSGSDASNGMRKPQHSTPKQAPMLIELAEKPTAHGHELKVMFYRQRDINTAICWVIWQ